MAKGLRKTLKRRASSKKVRVARRKTMKKTAGKRHRRSLRGGVLDLEDLEKELMELYDQKDKLGRTLGDLMADKAPTERINAKKAEIEKVRRQIVEVRAEIERIQLGRLAEITVEQLESHGAEQDPYDQFSHGK